MPIFASAMIFISDLMHVAHMKNTGQAIKKPGTKSKSSKELAHVYYGTHPKYPLDITGCVTSLQLGFSPSLARNWLIIQR